MKLYSVQQTFGFSSKQACYISLIVDECIHEMRHIADDLVYQRCEEKLDGALRKIGSPD